MIRSSPTSADVGLLILRLGAGASLFLLFGLDKLRAANAFLHTGVWEFVDFNRKARVLPVPVIVAFLAASQSITWPGPEGHAGRELKGPIDDCTRSAHVS